MSKDLLSWQNSLNNTKKKREQLKRLDSSLFNKCQLSRLPAKIILERCAMNVNRIAIISAPADQSILASKRSACFDRKMERTFPYNSRSKSFK